MTQSAGKRRTRHALSNVMTTLQITSSAPESTAVWNPSGRLPGTNSKDRSNQGFGTECEQNVRAHHPQAMS
jgi:hypothetical protein